jgi:hypothetical protein
MPIIYLYYLDFSNRALRAGEREKEIGHSARVLQNKGLGKRPGRETNHTKTDIEVAIIRVIVAAKGRTAKPRNVDPGTATQRLETLIFITG